MKRSHCSAAILALSISLFSWNPAAAQSAARAKRASVQTGLTYEDVIKLTKAGLAEDIVIQEVKKNGRTFDLSTDQLLALKAANVSDRVVEVMLDPSKAVVADAPPVASTIEVTRPPVQLEDRAAPVRAERPRHEELPGEIGVYVKKRSAWVEVSPEIVYWKTGGVLKAIATAGVRHGDVNGHIPGAESRTHLEGPLEFLIVAPEGTALSEYQLVRLHSNRDNREFRTVTGGFFHAESGAQRDIVPFDGKKVAGHVYQVNFPSDAGSGEYGFLPPGSNMGSGKIYSFRAVE